MNEIELGQKILALLPQRVMPSVDDSWKALHTALYNSTDGGLRHHPLMINRTIDDFRTEDGLSIIAQWEIRTHEQMDEDDAPIGKPYNFQKGDHLLFSTKDPGEVIELEQWVRNYFPQVYVDTDMSPRGTHNPGWLTTETYVCYDAETRIHPQIPLNSAWLRDLFWGGPRSLGCPIPFSDRIEIWKKGVPLITAYVIENLYINFQFTTDLGGTTILRFMDRFQSEYNISIRVDELMEDGMVFQGTCRVAEYVNLPQQVHTHNHIDYWELSQCTFFFQPPPF